MRQSRGPGAFGHTIPSVHLLPLPSVYLWCLLSVSSVPLAGLAGPGVTHLPGTLTPLSLPPFSPPLHRSMYHLSLPLFGFYIYFLFSVFSVCTIPWGCDRGEGAGHVEITSVYVPLTHLPTSWALAPSSRPPPLRGVLSSQTPPFL